MLHSSSNSPQPRVIGVVERLLAERSITGPIHPQDDLRDAGLTSLDMVSLVLAVEAEFDLLIPEPSISPANFRSVDAITSLVADLQRNR